MMSLGRIRHGVPRVAYLVVAAVFFLLSPVLRGNCLAFDPPPEVKNALWWGEVWGSFEISTKVVTTGDEVAFTATVHNGGVGEPQWTCTQWGWMASGTSGVWVSIPEGFELVDYGPKASSVLDVAVLANGIRWTAVPEDLPPLYTYITSTCYCSLSFWGASGNCYSRDIYPANNFRSGKQFTVILRATGSGCEWETAAAGFGGNIGALSWADTATDYYMLNGEYDLCKIDIELEADPSSVAIDESSELTATVIDMETGDPVPGQRVEFSVLSGTGVLSRNSAVTDSEGLVTTKLYSMGVEGDVEVEAAIPRGRSVTEELTFFADDFFARLKTMLGDNQDIPYLLEPVNAGIGNYVYSKTLFDFPSQVLPVSFRVSYNSRDADYDGPLGRGWTHNYNVFVEEGASEVRVKWGDGREEYYADDGSGGYAAVECQTRNTLVKRADGSWQITGPQGMRHDFTSDGALAAVSDPNGNTVTLTQETSPVSGEPRLARITDTAGRQIDLDYAAGTDRLAGVSTPLKGSGHTVSFNVDGSGDLLGVTDARSNSLGFGYDGQHRVTSHTDGRGIAAVSNGYDPEGRIAWQDNAAGDRTSFAYTEQPDGSMAVTITPPRGDQVTHRYNLAHQIKQITDGEGASAAFSYADTGERLSQRDKNGQLSGQVMDEKGNPIIIIDRLGARTEIEYDAFNQPTRIKDARGGVTTINRDAATGNWLSTTNALGAAVQVARDSRGLVTNYTNELGRSWQNQYNGANLLAARSDPLGNTVSYEYDGNGRLSQVDLADGNVIRLSFNEHNSLISQEDGEGNIIEYGYDANDNMVSRTFKPAAATDPADWAVTAMEYDEMNRLTKVTDAEGGVTTRAYDRASNLVAVTDPDGVTITAEYDGANRLVRRIDPFGKAEVYERDANGDVVAHTNRMGQTWNYEYDAKRRVTAVTAPSAAVQSYSYDAFDNITQVVDAAGRTTSHEYDILGRLTRTSHPDGSETWANYDRSGNLIMQTDSAGQLWRYSYDEVNRLASSLDPYGRTESYAYDSGSRLSAMTDRAGNEIIYSRNTLGQLTQATVTGDPEAAVQLSYDMYGNMDQAASAAGTVYMTHDRMNRRTSYTDVNGQVMEFGYTPAGRSDTFRYPGDVTVDFNRDVAGRVTGITDSFGNSTTIIPDALGRSSRIDYPNATWTERRWDDNGWLTGLTHGQAGSVDPLQELSISRDELGRITGRAGVANIPQLLGNQNMAATHGAAGELLTVTRAGETRSYTNDERGNIVSRTSPASSRNNTFDAYNRLRRVEDGTDVTENSFDALGSRVRRSYNGSVRNFLGDGNSVYAEYDDSGTVDTYYVKGGDSLLYSLDSAGNPRVYHGDGAGNVLAVTDAAGSLAAAYGYSSHGETVAVAGSLVNNLKYQGMLGAMTDENGMIAMKDGRFYSPEEERYASPSPLSNTSYANPYELADGNPLNHSPSGVAPFASRNRLMPTINATPAPLINPFVPTPQGKSWIPTAWKGAGDYGDNLETPMFLNKSGKPLSKEALAEYYIVSGAFQKWGQEEMANPDYKHGWPIVGHLFGWGGVYDPDCNYTHRGFIDYYNDPANGYPELKELSLAEIGVGLDVNTDQYSHRASSLVLNNPSGVPTEDDIIAVFDPIKTGTLGFAPKGQMFTRTWGNTAWHKSEQTFDEWMSWNTYVYGPGYGFMEGSQFSQEGYLGELPK